MRYLALATDFDGTLAQDEGHVTDETLQAVRRLSGSGRKLILVTGRQLPELHDNPVLGLCDCVVAENGALLYWPGENREEVLGDPPPPAFVAEIDRLNVKPCSLGRVIFAAWRPHEVEILQVIQRLGIGYQIVFNKRAVMVLPSNVNKATGLLAALQRLSLSPESVVGVGDAENDHAFLEVCGLAAAVDNALPALKDRCDMVMPGDHGRGVIQLIERLLADDLPVAQRRRTQPVVPVVAPNK